jgi:hypothetical protein
MMPTPSVALSPFCITATCHGRRFVGTKYNRNLPVEYTKSEDAVTKDHLSNLPQDATPEDGRIITPLAGPGTRNRAPTPLDPAQAYTN